METAVAFRVVPEVEKMSIHSEAVGIVYAVA
jgi:hypothetical protein